MMALLRSRLLRLVALLLSSLLSIVAAPLAAQAQTACPGDFRVITLGTGGGPLVRLKRSESANAVVIGDVAYLVDAGDRVLQQLEAAHLKFRQVRAVFITHHHLDHTAGVFPLLGIRWMMGAFSPLTLYGPPGMKTVAQGFAIAMQPSVAAGFVGYRDPLTNVDVQEVVPGQGVIYQDENVKVLAVENTHYHAPVSDPEKRPKSYAYRFETARGVVVFTGDTGPSEAVTELARHADLLVSEVIDLDATVASVKRGAPDLQAADFAALRTHLALDHLSPEQVGQMARQAGVKQVVLSHLSPGLDSEDATQAEAMYGADVRKAFSGPVTVAGDLQTFCVHAP